jgi:RNA polymerase sigma-70 factor (ECF subfamily)
MTIKAISAPSTPAGRSATSSDDVLVARARAGDSRAFELLAERHSTPLRLLLYRITRDCEAAKDAVQEALVSAWRSIGGFEGRSRFSTWFTRIGINAAYGGMRGQRELTCDPQDGIGEQVPDWVSQPDEVFESREFLAAVDGALAELSTDYRVIRLMREVRRERMTAEGLRQGLDAVGDRRAALEAEDTRLKDEIGALRAESASKNDWSSLHRPSRAA